MTKLRKVYITIPILLNTTSSKVEKDIYTKFGKHIFSGLDYEENLDYNNIIGTINAQQEIIKEINNYEDT